MTKRVRLYQSTLRIPDDIRALFGDPPVLSTEDPNAYWALLGRVAAVIKPRNVIEWMWVNDVVYHSCEIRRLRRFKTLEIEEERKSLAHGEEELLRHESRHARSDRCPTDELNTDRGSGLAFRYTIGLYERIDELLESAERRLNAVLREIHYYREGLAHLLEEFSNKIIDAEYEEAAE